MVVVSLTERFADGARALRHALDAHHAGRGASKTASPKRPMTCSSGARAGAGDARQQRLRDTIADYGRFVHDIVERTLNRATRD